MNFRHDFFLKFFKLLNAFVITALFGVISAYFYPGMSPFNVDTSYTFVIMSIIYIFLYVTFGKIYDAFLISVARVSELVLSQTLSFFIVDILSYLILCLIERRVLSVIGMIILLAIQTVFSIVWSISINHWYYRHFSAKSTIIVYETREGMEDLIQDYGLERKFDVQKVVTVEECLSSIDMLYDYQTIFLSGVHSRDRNTILKYAIFNKKVVYVVPRLGDIIMRGASQMYLFHLPMVMVSSYRPSFIFLIFKRAFDIVTSLAGLIILSPVFLATAVAIKFSDHGPVFYKQERMTRGGKKFMIHKFRSMRIDAEKDGVARLSSGENDDRITPVGHIIRKYRIDELPQLIDILSGNLSVVGPRPEREEIARQYEEVMPEFRLRLQAKAGLTGLAQVYGKYNSTPYDKLMMDLMYIAHPSILEDLKICFATLKILFLPESTEGIEAGAITAMNDSQHAASKRRKQ